MYRCTDKIILALILYFYCFQIYANQLNSKKLSPILRTSIEMSVDIGKDGFSFFSKSGKFFISGKGNGYVTVHNTVNKKNTMLSATPDCKKPHSNGNRVLVSDDEQSIALTFRCSNSEQVDSELVIYDLNTSSQTYNRLGDYISLDKISSKASYIAYSTVDDYFVEDVKNRHIVYQKDTIYEGSVAFSNNEKYFTYMDDDGDEDDESLVHVDLQTGSKRVLAQNIRSAFRPMKETYFSNDDRFLLLSSRDGNTVKVYDFSKNSFSYQRGDAYLSGHIEHITSDSKYLVSLRTVFDQGSTKIAYNEIEVFDLANAITINKTKYPATVSHITRDESYYFKHDSLVLSKDELTIYSLRDASDEGIDEENKNRQINIHSIDLKSFTDIKIAEVSSHMDDLDCYDFSGVCGIKYSSINALIKNKSEEQNLTSLASVVLASGVTFSLDLNGVRNVYNYELSPDSRYFYTTNKSGMLWLFKILD